MTRDAPSSWAASHDGELLIISHAAFMDALAPLVARRVQEGWTVQIADVQDVYDEQGFGDKSPAAIRAFIQRARASWRVPPRFVLFVGDATFDPRNFMGKGDFDFVPTRLIDTAAMETASDDWFVDDDLDGVPEIAIGRLPVRTAAQASAIVGKLLAYAGKANLSRGGLFVTDTDERRPRLLGRQHGRRGARCRTSCPSIASSAVPAGRRTCCSPSWARGRSW